MGINLVVGCPVHHERMWIYRNHEAAGLATFFKQHAGCGEKLISHDQSSDDWVNVGGLWGETTYPEREDE